MSFPKQRVSEAALKSLLGAPLSPARITIGLNPGIRQEVKLATQPGIEIPVRAYRPGPTGADPARGALIALDDRGREALNSDEVVLEARRQGWPVFAIDPRGIWELKTGKDGFIFGVSLLLGENFASGLFARGKNSTLSAAYVAATADQSPRYG